MGLNIAPNTAFRTESELGALVKAIFDADAGTQETNWVEWKSSLDLGGVAGRFPVGKAILGFANRSPDQAQLACEGAAYMVVGVKPGRADGVTSFDHASLGQKIRTHADGPRWTPHYVDFAGVTVLVIVVEAPRVGDPIHTLQKAYDKWDAGTVFHRGTAQTEPAGPKEIQMLQERLLQGTRQPDLDLDLGVDAEPLTRLNIDRETLRAWIDRREEYIRSTRRPPATSGQGIMGVFSAPQDPKDVELFNRRVSEHILQCRERLAANLFRAEAESQENKVAFDVGNQTKEAIEGVQLIVQMPAADLAVYAGLPRARPMPPLPAWPDPLDGMRLSSRPAVMDSLVESQMYTRADAAVTTREGVVEITYDIGDLRPGEVVHTRPTTIIPGPSAPDELAVTLIGRSMNRRGVKTASHSLTVSSYRWELDDWLPSQAG